MRRLFLTYCFIVPGLVSCSDRFQDRAATDEDAKVYLAAEVRSGSGTRAPYVPTEDDNTFFDAPTYDKPLYADVWASSTPKVFEDKNLAGSVNDPTVAIHTFATFQNSGPQLLHNVIYSKNGYSLYFIAFSPRSKWDDEAGIKATASFDGTEDLMFAPQVEGKYGNKDANGVLIWPTLSFHHLLTWLRFEFIAESEGVSSTWGKIKDIRIICKNRIAVDLSKEFDSNNPNESIQLIGEDIKMPLYTPGTDLPFPGSDSYEIPYLAAAEKAYVLCAPVDAQSAAGTPEYTLIVTTENRTAEVAIDLKEAADKYYSGSTRAKQFTIKLIFKVGDRITAAASIKDWENGGVIEGIVDEN